MGFGTHTHTQVIDVLINDHLCSATGHYEGQGTIELQSEVGVRQAHCNYEVARQGNVEHVLNRGQT